MRIKIWREIKLPMLSGFFFSLPFHSSNRLPGGTESSHHGFKGRQHSDRKRRHCLSSGPDRVSKKKAQPGGG